MKKGELREVNPDLPRSWKDMKKSTESGVSDAVKHPRTPRGMLSYRTWTRYMLLMVIGVVGAVVLVNFIVDAYGVLRTDFSRQFQRPNERFVKIEYLIGNKAKYDSFLFGSSRVLHIDTGLIKNGRYYNLGYAEGLPQEHLDNIKLLLRKGVRIKNLVIALDDFSYRVDPEQHRTDLLFQPHYLVSGKGKVDFYCEYFLKMTRLVPSVRDYITHNYTEEGRAILKRTFYDIYGSGRVICTTCDDEIANDVEKHNRDSVFDKPFFYYGGNNLSRTLKSLKELVLLSRKNNINLMLFINPIHKTTYLGTDLPLFFAFKKELADITSYYDFSGLNTITTNNFYYHETSHYRHIVGDMILRRMFGYPAVRVPQDFGVFVTARNISAHIKRQRAELDAALKGQAADYDKGWTRSGQ